METDSLTILRLAAFGTGAHFPWRAEYREGTDRALLVNSLGEVVGNLENIRHAEIVAALTEMAAVVSA